jgi:hypothetical protein
VERRPDLRLIERRLLPPFGLFTLARIERITCRARVRRAPADGASAEALEQAPT